MLHSVLLPSSQPLPDVFKELCISTSHRVKQCTGMILHPWLHLQVPVALACSAPEARVLPELQALGLSERLAAVVTAEDVARGRPDPEAVLLAAQRLGRPPIRCVLIGEPRRLPALLQSSLPTLNQGPNISRQQLPGGA
jgi:beta-phosphoglucomutase-like phosphatase (HAD superfamily)